ncbi:MAG: methionine ABC transporter ATP-binding protein [Xylanivirga thermophila]|jgi:D-methionine transport system ATP-binding protein|uniref:methionine ABC transporter ATP-binding protein n=1 Tax=Xylanivirga thermophila TaxID=2496273 RepID=UPI00101BAD3B|nr:methionine ABC transporter ATP-binding protein [Xylanivirga thermophila]
MITINNLSKYFETDTNKIWAVKNVDLHVNRGEILGVIGLSGAGKSTFIRCLNRLEEPTEGQIIIDGVDMTSLSKKELRAKRKEIGMIFQHFNLLLQKTVAENIALPLELSGMARNKIDSRVDELLKYVELTDKKNAYPSQLSGGQKQRVAIARALANNPKVLLSDEATSALDPKTTKSILELLNKIRHEFGLTIVMITHQMEVVKDICDRVAIIENGEIIEINTVEEIFRHPQSKTAKEFISDLKFSTEDEFIKPDGCKGRIIRLNYLGENAKKPIISQMVKRFDIDVNILSGNINEILTTSAGHLILELIGEGAEIETAIEYLKDQNVDVEVM